MIVIFVLATPRSWFHDRPHATVGEFERAVRLGRYGSQTRIYRLDAAALPPEKRATKPTPELERETHDILGRTVDDLKGRHFKCCASIRCSMAMARCCYYDVTSFVKAFGVSFVGPYMCLRRVYDTLHSNCRFARPSARNSGAIHDLKSLLDSA